jgi:crotonobetainyl-CoA:carnitine CoA-transferase CaiB-like acyl-CoA transferase
LVALGNDRQFRAFCELIGRPDLPDDPRFVDNGHRSPNRAALQDELRPSIAQWKSDDLIAAMEAAKLPGGRVNEIPDILADEHIAARGVIRDMVRSDGTAVKVLGYPGKLSKTPADYRRAPPRSGEDTRAVLGNLLGIGGDELAALVEAGVVAEKLH